MSEREAALNNSDQTVKMQAIDVVFGILVSGFLCQLIAGGLQHILHLNKSGFILLFLVMFLPRMLWLIAKYHYSRRRINSSLDVFGQRWRDLCEAGVGRRYKTCMSRPLRRLTGGTGFVLVGAADTAYVAVMRTGYWNGLLIGGIASIGIVLSLWWMSE